MNLQTTISILAGGQGSGCHGPNCGKKMGNFNKNLLTKATSMKNMKEMSKMLLAHGFTQTPSVGNYQKGARTHGAPILGSPGLWKRSGVREVPADPMKMQSLYQTHRFHEVLTSPAGWHHTSVFQGQTTEHGRGLGADTLDKQLTKHGL